MQEDAGYPAVASVEIVNPFNLKDAEDAKRSVVDVRVRDIYGTTAALDRAGALVVLYNREKRGGSYGRSYYEGDSGDIAGDRGSG